MRDIERRPGQMREIELSAPASEKWGAGLVFVPADEPIALELRLESMHEGILASGMATTRYEGVCGRCLEDIDAALEVEFQELFTYPEREAADFEVQDNHVDLENLVRDAIVLSLPFQPVCEPDCPGLDPDTGVRKSHETDEQPRAALDSRWAALQHYTTDHDDEQSRPSGRPAGVSNIEKS